MGRSRPVVLTSSEEYICLRNFMIAEGGLGLSGVKAQVYALVYSHSPADTLENDTGCYFGSIDYTAARTGASRRAVIDAIKGLLADGLILEKGNHVQGDSTTTKKYIANRERAVQARERFDQYWGLKSGAMEETAPERKNVHLSGEISAPGYACAGADSSPENESGNRPGAETSPDAMTPRAETSPARETAGAESAPGQVQILHPIAQVDSLGFDLNRNSTPSPTPPKPSVGGMGRANTDREIKADLDPELLAAVKELMLRSLNQRAPLAEVVPAYREALAKGYTPEQIDRGYTAYIARYRKLHPGDPTYAIRLTNYLLRGDGLATDEPEPEQGPEAKARARRDLMQRLHDEGDPEFLALYGKLITDDEVARGKATGSEQQIMQWKFNDYLAYRQGKKGTAWERHMRAMLTGGRSEETRAEGNSASAFGGTA